MAGKFSRHHQDRIEPDAERRQARINAHVEGWRDAFFDLIAGKPHLPSLPPPGHEQDAALPVPSMDAAPAAAAPPEPDQP